jgi:phage terminase small subunit
MAGRYPQLAEDTTSKVVAFPGAEEKSEMSDQEAKKIALQSRPRGMSKQEQKVWETDIPAYVKINRLKAHFIRFFKEYCIVVARMEITKANLDKVGWQYKTTGRNGDQFKAQPGVAQYNDDWRKLNSLINQLGGSPATDKRFDNLQPGLFDDLY